MTTRALLVMIYLRKTYTIRSGAPSRACIPANATRCSTTPALGNVPVVPEFINPRVCFLTTLETHTIKYIHVSTGIHAQGRTEGGGYIFSTVVRVCTQSVSSAHAIVSLVTQTYCVRTRNVLLVGTWNLPVVQIYPFIPPLCFSIYTLLRPTAVTWRRSR